LLENQSVAKTDRSVNSNTTPFFSICQAKISAALLQFTHYRRCGWALIYGRLLYTINVHQDSAGCRAADKRIILERRRRHSEKWKSRQALQTAARF